MSDEDIVMMNVNNDGAGTVVAPVSSVRMILQDALNRYEGAVRQDEAEIEIHETAIKALRVNLAQLTRIRDDLKSALRDIR